MRGKHDALIRKLISVGRVNNVNVSRGTVNVLFEDRDNQISDDLPVISSAQIPTVGDQVVCIFLGNSSSEGFCLGTFREGGPS